MLKSVYQKKKKIITEENEEAEGKVGYFRFEEKHTHAHISYHTYSSLLLWTDKSAFLTCIIPHTRTNLYIDLSAATVCNDTFLYGIAICQSFLKLNANPNKKCGTSFFQLLLFLLLVFHVENFYTWLCQLIHIASKASIL